MNSQLFVIFFTLILGFITGSHSFGINCPIALPECPNPNIKLWLYTRWNWHRPHELTLSDKSSFPLAPFIKDAPFVLLIHGYTGNKDYAPNPEVRPAYLKRGNYNILSVDYGALVPDGCYITSVKNVPVVSKCLAQMIDYLVETGYMALEDLHIVGMSLGAHVAGGLPNYMMSGKLRRITGLDPAYPLIIWIIPFNILDKNDAQFVDVIHTNILARGEPTSLGHADFYLNEGFHQPGCQNSNMTESSCSHWRATVYYGESINSEVGFVGRKCKWMFNLFGACNFNNNTEEALMGAYCPETTRGNFYLDTTDKAPFAKGRYWTKS